MISERMHKRNTRRAAAKFRPFNILLDEPLNIKQEIAFWFAWRVSAARYFVGWGLPPFHPNGDPVCIDEMLPGMYWPRFFQGLRFGVRGVRRARREMIRKYKSVTQVTA